MVLRFSENIFTPFPSIFSKAFLLPIGIASPSISAILNPFSSTGSFSILQKYLEESIGDTIFNILRIFEEDGRFKLIYEEDGKQINLVEISEMLKAEPIIENGWIERFSKYAKEKE